jgi:hypothetical protein
MKTHLKTLSTIAVVIAFITCLKYFPGITIGAVIFMFFYALIYSEIQKTEQRKKDHDNDER